MTARDKGQPVKSSSVQVRIQVSDENDNSPFFYPQIYYVALPSVVRRNSPPLLVLSGRDDDIGINSKLKYKLESSGKLVTNTEDVQNSDLYLKSGQIDVRILAVS